LIARFELLKATVAQLFVRFCFVVSSFVRTDAAVRIFAQEACQGRR
jgi:hypothetical protein